MVITSNNRTSTTAWESDIMSPLSLPSKAGVRAFPSPTGVGFGPLFLAVTLSGCGMEPVKPQPPETISYRCDQGTGYSVAYHASGKTARIDIDGMAFTLLAEPDQLKWQQFGCGVLNLRVRGRQSQLRFQGEDQWRECHQRSAPTAVRLTAGL